MSTPKPVWWVTALMTRFEEQLPCRIGPQTPLTRINVQQNKESLIHISQFKFSLVISGLTKILTKISEMPSASLPEFEREHYDSQLIVLDTLEKCLSSPAPEELKHDDVVNVKLLLKELCQFLDLPANADNSQAAQIRNLASKVLLALSVNNFNAVFGRINGCLQELSVSCGEESHAGNLTDIELIQHIHLDRSRLTRLLQEASAKFRTLRKTAHLVLITNLERAIWNWMDAYPQV